MNLFAICIVCRWFVYICNAIVKQLTKHPLVTFNEIIRFIERLLTQYTLQQIRHIARTNVVAVYKILEDITLNKEFIIKKANCCCSWQLIYSNCIN